MMRGLGLGLLRASHMGHAHDGASGGARGWCKSRGLEVVRCDVRCGGKSGGRQGGEPGARGRIVTYTKRPHPNEEDLDSLTGKMQTQTNRATLPALSRSDSPFVKFWTREEWSAYNSARKDTSSTKLDSPRCGPMDYIEEVDGTPVSATTITDI
jgi:hypothetical protein